jgi:hypothetical protein
VTFIDTQHKALPIKAEQVIDLPRHGEYGALDYLTGDVASRNRVRAASAAEAVHAYVKGAGLRTEEPATAISDLICDLGHLIDALGLDSDDLFGRGRWHYGFEVEGEG